MRAPAIALIASLCFVATGCGQDDWENLNDAADAAELDKILPDTRPGSSDRRLLPYVELYESLIGVDAGDIIVTFADLDGSTGGHCNFHYDGRRSIEIDRGYWSGEKTPGLSGEGLELLRENVIFHELGHCVQELNHKNGTHLHDLPGGGRAVVPDSIMYPSAPIPHYRDLRDYYVEELRDQFGLAGEGADAGAPEAASKSCIRRVP